MTKTNRYLPVVFILASMMTGWFLAVRIWTDDEDQPVQLPNFEAFAQATVPPTAAIMVAPSTAFDNWPGVTQSIAVAQAPASQHVALSPPEEATSPSPIDIVATDIVPPAVEYASKPLTAFEVPEHSSGLQPAELIAANTRPGATFHPPVGNKFEVQPVTKAELTAQQRQIIESSTPSASGALAELTDTYADVCLSPSQTIIFKSQVRHTTVASKPDVNVQLHDLPGPSAIELLTKNENVCRDPASTIHWAPVVSLSTGDRGVEPAEVTSLPPIASCWPRPKAIERSLDSLRGDPLFQPWLARLEGDFNALSKLETFQDQRATVLFGSIQRLVHEGWKLSQQTNDMQHAVTTQRAAYALTRRLETWSRVHKIAVSDSVPQKSRLKYESLATSIIYANHKLKAITHADTWRTYLLLTELYEAATQKQASDHSISRLARISLARLEGADQQPIQQAFFAQPEFVALQSELKHWASDPVDYRELLNDIEAYELSGETSAAATVASHYQKLRWSPALAAELGRQIDTRYRDANLCFQVSDEFINRFVPKSGTYNEPIATNVAGASVVGNSTTQNQLRIRLLPDNEKIKIALETWGVVDSNTQASQGPVTVFNQGRSHFQARKVVQIGREGIDVQRSQSSANSQINNVGMQTDYDNIPLIREVVRSIADRKQREMAGQTRAESDFMLRRKVEQKFDNEVATKLAGGREALYNQVVGKLAALNLHPQVVGMSSTDHTALVRYRVANESQLGAHTPRPQSQPGSMMCAQVHETAVNNFVERLGFDGQQMRVEDLIVAVSKKLGFKDQSVPDNLPEDVTLQFAAKDCLRIFFDDDQVRVSLRLAKLQHGEKVWRNFAVTASFRPEVKGFSFSLLRDGSIGLEGKRIRFRDQIALRAIFSKVFSNDRPLVLQPPNVSKDPRFADLRISQLSIDDGWIGLAVGAKPKQFATNPTATLQQR